MPELSATFTVGDVEVAALSDGAPERALGGFFHGVDPAEWTEALGITDPEQPMPFNFGTFLLRDGRTNVLVDTGLGAAGAASGVPGGGELVQRLADLGVAAEDIRNIVHTHLHFDHCAGNMRDGAPVFPNAVFYVSRLELDYWLHDESADPEPAKLAQSAIQPLLDAGRVATFDGEYTITRGLTTVPTPGHTPGHTSLLLTSQGEHLVITGDAAHHPKHFEHPDWIPEVDIDPTESTRSRGRLSALAVEHDALVTGGHFPILTLGKLRAVETGYVWEAVEA
jgi:glyoxylase-like metal-dependent hydrolase (beta-lactamase superfamily II)